MDEYFQISCGNEQTKTTIFDDEECCHIEDNTEDVELYHRCDIINREDVYHQTMDR